MKAIVQNICTLMHNVSLAFEGNLGSQDGNVIRKEILSGRIPTVADDKENLKNDGRKIAGDLGKAFDEYVTTHS